MIIKSLRVNNFRCICEEELVCDRLTVLVGRNGTGKTAFVRALEFFYTPGYDLTEDDYFARDTDTPVSVEVTFCELTAEEKDAYAPYIDGDTLAVTKEASWPPARGSERYYGSSMRCPDFTELRRLTGRERTSAYSEYVSSGRFPDLRPGVTRAADVDGALQEWEEQYPERCQRQRDEGQFFGFHNVGAGKLEKFTRFVLVPAVRDARDDATEGRASALGELLDIVVKRRLDENLELTSFRETTKERYHELLDLDNLPELPQLADDLSRMLRVYAPDSEVRLRWQELSDPQLPLPTAQARLVEDEFEGDVSRTGHGLQRAFILTLLQHLSSIRGQEAAVAESAQPVEGQGAPDSAIGVGPASVTVEPHLVLAIEEPELYLHPVRARHFARVLRQLSEPSASDQAIQVLYSTHSPLLTDIRWFGNVRLLRKTVTDDRRPKRTTVRQTTLDDVADELETAAGYAPGTFTRESLQLRLLSLMSPSMNEGFFADCLVLVEGETDQAALVATARQMGHNLEALGIVVIPAHGKTRLDKPLIIFRQLGIPVFVIFDADAHLRPADRHPETNRLLLRLLGEEEDDSPETAVKEAWACFNSNLEGQLKQDIGAERYDSELGRLASAYGYESRADAAKNCGVVEEMLDCISREGGRPATLERIVEAVVRLRERSSTLPSQ